MRKFDYRKISSSPWASEVLGLVAFISEAKGKEDLYLRQKPEKLDAVIFAYKKEIDALIDYRDGVFVHASGLKNAKSQRYLTFRSLKRILNMKSMRSIITA